MSYEYRTSEDMKREIEELQRLLAGLYCLTQPAVEYFPEAKAAEEYLIEAGLIKL